MLPSFNKVLTTNISDLLNCQQYWFQEAKIARQNKIKSKSYRRHMRKQKAKEKEKEMEELQVSTTVFCFP